MKLGKKKKGSVLLVVVGIFAFISIMIVSVMSMTTTGFKLKKTENARIENFYGADSGIEIADSIIVEIINGAIDHANNKVKEESDKNSNLKYDDKNTIFKKSYIEHIQQNYKKEIEKEEKYEILIDESKNEKVKIVASIYPTEYIDDIKELDTTVNSTFIDKDEKEREVEVSQKIKVPDYGVKAFGNGDSNDGSDGDSGDNNKEKDDSLINYLGVSDGNLYINHLGASTFSGHIWIKGRTDEVNYENRFDNGIHIIGNPSYGASSIDWYGKLVTQQAVNIKNSSIEIEQVFARDMILKDNTLLKKQGKNNGNDKNLESGIWIYNDLFMQGNNINLDVFNYYGLNDINNDKSILYGKQEGNRTGSSSIIINSDDFGKTSKLKADKLVIAGTAYLGNAETDSLLNYQSGESIVINRNTAPYTQRYNNENYKYSYKNPLHVIDESYKNDSQSHKPLVLQDKIKLVEKYYGIENKSSELDNVKELTNNEKILFQGIEAQQINNVGVAYNKGNVIKGNNMNSLDLKKQQKIFVEEVLLRGKSATEDEYIKHFWNLSTSITSLGGSIWRNELNKVIESGIVKNKKNEKIFEAITDTIENFAVFKGVNDIKDILFCDKDNHPNCEKKCIPPGQISEIFKNEIKLIFNTSGKKIIVESTNVKDDKIYESNDSIKIKINFEEEVAMVLSLSGEQGNGDVELLNEIVTHTIGLPIWTEGDITYNIKTSANFGNYHNNKDTLKNMLTLIFNFEELTGILGGSISGGGENPDEKPGEDNPPQSSVSSNDFINASDLMVDRKWKVIR